MNRTPDDLDDLTLPQRPRRSDGRAEYRSEMRSGGREDLRDEIGPPEREFTLSTGTVLGLFFGLALVCAVFFGFGYSMGRKSAAAALPAADTVASGTADVAATEVPAANKPSAGSPVIPAIPGYQSSQKDADTANRTMATSRVAPAGSATTVTVPIDGPAVKPKKTADDPDGRIVEAPRTAPAHTASTGTTALSAGSAAGAGVPATAAGGTNYVQIAAVSHKEDADVLLSALKRRGYTVFTRPSDSDTLIHVQVGPFASKKDAEAMRQKLLGDGYNAILK